MTCVFVCKSVKWDVKLYNSTITRSLTPNDVLYMFLCLLRLWRREWHRPMPSSAYNSTPGHTWDENYYGNYRGEYLLFHNCRTFCNL